MKPPVEAPRSAQIRPAGSIGKTSSAPSSLSAPRETYRCGAAPSLSRIGAAGSTSAPGLSTRASPTTTAPAITSACALARDSASPRSTSRTSIRCLRGTRPVPRAPAPGG